MATGRGVLLSWAAAGVMMVTVLGSPPVTRLQEARLLETAREMLGQPLHDWLVPHLNGHVRLEKPPLGYWLSAWSFRALGVDEAAGRLPSAMASWLTAGITFLIGSWLFGRRAGFLAAAILLSSAMFVAEGRLAETDALVMLWTTAAAYWLWRGSGIDGPDAKVSCGYFYLGAVAVGLAILSKGLPALFPVVFFILLAALRGRSDVLGRWILSGAPLLALVIGLSWYAYIWRLPEWKIVQREFTAVMQGVDHPGPVYAYLGYIFPATLPWCGFLVAAVISSLAGHWRKDPRVGALTLWAGTILVMLSVVRQKQPHYLLPALPPLALLSAWLIDYAIRNRDDAVLRRVMGPLLVWTFVVAGAAGAAGVLEAAHWMRGAIGAVDWVLAILWLVAMGAGLRVHQRRGLAAGAVALAAAAVLLAPTAVGIWAPSLQHGDVRRVASSLRGAFGLGPYCCYGQETSLPLMMPLVWSLRDRAPLARTPEQLRIWGRAHAGLVVITAETRQSPALPPPAEFAPVMGPMQAGDAVFRAYRR